MLLDTFAAEVKQSFTLTYDDLGLNNNDPIPDPYPGITAANVTHYGADQAGRDFQDTFFWGGVSPGNGYGDLVNVAFGPRGNPSEVGLIPPPWGVINIAPADSNTFVRLISFDIASFDDNNVDEAGVQLLVHDAANRTYWAFAGYSPAGDLNNTAHTHVDYFGFRVEGPVGVPLSLWWESRAGRVGLDNVRFEIVGSGVTARNDLYTVREGATLTVEEPGVLGNDSLGGSPGPLSATLISEPAHGTLDIGASGAFTYTPQTNFTGIDRFTYQANDGLSNSSAAVSMISVLPPGALFYDDFARPAGVAAFTLWQVRSGAWTIENGLLEGTNALNSLGHVHVNNQWTNCSVEARARMPADGFGWSVSGRLNATNGKRYAVFLVPVGAEWKLRLIKYTGWDAWSGNRLSGQPDVSVPGAGTTNLHALKMTFFGNRILVHFDGIKKMDVMDNNFEGPPYLSGGITVGMYTDTNSYVLTVEDVMVRQVPAATNLVVETPKNTATNLMLPGSVGEGLKTFSILSGPTNGALSNLDTNTGAVTYRPATNYLGPDAFSFTVGDGTLLATGLVSITVTSTNAAPPPLDLIVEIEEDMATNLVLLSVGEGPQLFAILDGPTNGVLSNLDANSGAVTYSPATNYHGPDAFTYTASDGSLVATGQVSVTVTPVNDAPAAANVSIETPEDTPTNLVLPGSDVEGAVTFAILSGPANGVMSGVDTNTGAVTYASATNYHGPDAFTYIASDGSLVATGQVSVTVTPVNDAPVLAALESQSIDELTTLWLTNVASDADVPANTMTFTMVGGPTNAVLDPRTGELTWMPTEDQGPGTNRFIALVTDDGMPPLSDTNGFVVVVREVNQAPVLSAIENQAIVEGQTLIVTHRATDPDIPANTLSFTLGEGAPTGMTMTTDGVLTWTPELGQAPGTNVVSVIVGDDGIPGLIVTQMFEVTVVPQPFLIESVTVSNTVVTVTWSAVEGVTYRLEYADNPGETDWTAVSPDVTAVAPTASATDASTGARHRFYRVLRLP